MSQTRTVSRDRAANRQAPNNAASASKPTPVHVEMAVFMASLESERTVIRSQLPSDVDLDTFINTAKIAVTQNPDLLAAVLRQSLFIALQKAARQGLMPDGKQGALIVRWNSERRCEEVCWQPMVWGMVSLGRRTGDIRTFSAQIVYQNEPFRILQGEEDRYEHERVPEHEAKGLEFAVGAYCIITGRDGVRTRRWMSAPRIRAVKDSSKAARGPWHGSFEDEMWIKTVLLFTMKWVNTNAATNIFKEAVNDLQDSLEVDLNAAGVERRGPVIDSNGAPAAPAIARRGSRLDEIETTLDQRRTAKAPALEHEKRGPDPLAGLNRGAEPERVPMEGEVEAPGAALQAQRQAQVGPPRDQLDSRSGAPASSAARRPFRVFVKEFDGAPGNEGKPILSAMALVRWVEFQLTQITVKQRTAFFKANQDALDLAYSMDEDAAVALNKFASAPAAGESSPSTGKGKPVVLTEGQKAEAWASDMIGDQINPAPTMALLDACTVNNEAFRTRMGRYDREHPSAAARIRSAYDARRSELSGGAR